MQEQSKKAAEHLMKTVRPILLQRKKCEHKTTLKLKDKEEIVVWIPLASTQRKVYEKYLLKRTVKDAMERTNFAVDVINDLKTISRHPFLMEASEKIRRINAAKKDRDGGGSGGGGGGDGFDMSDINDALDSLSSGTPRAHNGDGRRNIINSSNSDYNIGRAKDPRFNSRPQVQGPSSSSSHMNNSNSNSSNSSNRNRGNSDNNTQSSRDIDDDEEIEGNFEDYGSNSGIKKLSANSDVFEIAGRRPDAEELLQVIILIINVTVIIVIMTSLRNCCRRSSLLLSFVFI